MEHGDVRAVLLKGARVLNAVEYETSDGFEEILCLKEETIWSSPGRVGFANSSEKSCTTFRFIKYFGQNHPHKIMGMFWPILLD
jgi:hypothetical protein